MSFLVIDKNCQLPFYRDHTIKVSLRPHMCQGKMGASLLDKLSGLVVWQ